MPSVRTPPQTTSVRSMLAGVESFVKKLPIRGSISDSRPAFHRRYSSGGWYSSRFLPSHSMAADHGDGSAWKSIPASSSSVRA